MCRESIEGNNHAAEQNKKGENIPSTSAFRTQYTAHALISRNLNLAALARYGRVLMGVVNLSAIQYYS